MGISTVQGRNVTRSSTDMPASTSNTRLYVLTGATSGVGLHIARRLAREPGVEIIAGARFPGRTDALRAAVPAGRLSVLPLDLADLASVRTFADAVVARLGDEGQLAGVVCNAGLQILGPKQMTTDGVEATFGTNHLGHYVLVERLLDRLVPGAVVTTTGSGTHNPDEKLATTAGFRGAVFRDAATVASGDLGPPGSELERALDRYATSKLCNILHVRALAARVPEDRVRFFSFDPGLMPGTGLARDRSAIEQFAWRYVMPLIRPFVRGVSSPKTSGRALVERLLLAPESYPSGSYVEFTGRPAPRHPIADDDAMAADLDQFSQRFARP